MVVALVFSQSGAVVPDLEAHTPTVDVALIVTPSDGRPHRVQLFFEITGQTVVDTDVDPVIAARSVLPSGAVDLSMAHVQAAGGSTPSVPFGPWLQPKEHLDWGAGHLAVPAGQPGIAGIATYLGSSNTARQQFAQTGTLPSCDAPGVGKGQPACGGSTPGTCRCAAGAPGDWTTMAVAFDMELAAVQHPALAPDTANATATANNANATTAGLVLAMDDLGKTVRFFGAVMPEYWRRNSTSFTAMLDAACTGHAASRARAAQQDTVLGALLERVGGRAYAVVAAMTFRQVFGDNSIVWYDGTTGNFTAGPAPSMARSNGGSTGRRKAVAGKTPPSAMMFVKGLGSSGDTGTIDDNYPAALLYLWGQPELLNALLRPINMFMANETHSAAYGFPRNLTFPEPYCVHYLGQYPVAEMQCWQRDRCEPMPLEMTADNLQMTVRWRLLF